MSVTADQVIFNTVWRG